MLTRSDPFRDALSLRRVMDQLLEQSFVRPGSLPDLPALRVPVDIRETSNGYEVDVALPGVEPEDIDLTVDQNTLTIRGEFSYQNNQDQSQDQSQDQGQGKEQEQRGRRRHQQRGRNYLAREIVYGAFERVITLPRPIDVNNIQTSIQNGILKITLPVSEAGRPKQISVKGGQAQAKQVTAGTGQQQGQHR
jgi:HSP20 family protein